MAEDWSTAAEIAAQLDRLSGQHIEKQRRTILALVDARLAGRTEESVWSIPGTCNRTTYHLKWKKQEPFASVLDACTKAARAHRDGASARALAQAAERLALAAPPAVGRLITLLNSDDEAIILRSAVAILDRAGIETGTKTTTSATMEIADWRADAANRRQLAAETMAAFDELDDDGNPPDLPSYEEEDPDLLD